MKEQTNLVFMSRWIEQLKPLLGPMMPDFLRSYEMPPVRGLRVRPGLPPPPEAQEKVPWAENGYYIPLDSAAGAHPLHEAGAYYLQEPSAMAPAAVLRPQPGEKVLVMTPVYNIFFNSILNNGRVPEVCPLKYDGRGYDIDWDRTEKSLDDPQVSLVILCNPHNPVGKVWDAETLARLARLCREIAELPEKENT